MFYVLMLTRHKLKFALVTSGLTVGHFTLESPASQATRCSVPVVYFQSADMTAQELKTAERDDEAAAAPVTTKPQDAPFVYETPGFFADDSRVPQWVQNLVTDLFSFVTIHYNIWGVPFLALFYYLYKIGYGYVPVALVALYLPSFLSGAQKTAKGNTWPSFRSDRIWGLSAKFLG